MDRQLFIGFAAGSPVSAETQRFARGALWLFSARWLERLLEFASILVLARLLAPQDFGLVAIAASIAVIIEGLSALDVNKALIRHREEGRDLYDTAWTLAVLRGVLVAAVMLLVAAFLDDPRLAAIVCVLALSPLISGLANPRFMLFERALEYSKPALASLWSRLVSFLVTVTIALATQSYWALVVGMLVNAAALTVLT